ncbi:hypothetical protein [Streptomyces marincola]|uniref:Uncharacterized protein n=1 Tax=Streptomyces marincola TaxID=2878388 RepID=A0A1W7D409_9ACTN|nr:hypothetical protein [Streptomyces marincola]ARQ71833.1 hypothetical protein CAG99_26060 [Streptomyces marincola]
MAPTTRRARRADRFLRESAGTVAVIADAGGFAAMRRYATFRFTDHAGYLRQTELLLRSLAERHGHTSVALFDPEGFAEFCAREGLAADSQASRARYTAEVAARGATVPYEGQPIARLMPVLLAEHLRWETWETGTDLLAAAGSCPACDAPYSRCAFQRAAGLLAAVTERAGPGAHHLVCSLLVPSGPLTAALHVERGAGGALDMAEPDALVLCTLVAVGLATGEPGGLVLRSAPAGAGGGRPERPAPGRQGEPAGPVEEVRGWSLRGGRLRALSEGEVFAAYCTDVRTGEPVPPEPGVAYRAAEELPHRDCPGD